jgi:hypothetical protein
MIEPSSPSLDCALARHSPRGRRIRAIHPETWAYNPLQIGSASGADRGCDESAQGIARTVEAPRSTPPVHGSREKKSTRYSCSNSPNATVVCAVICGCRSLPRPSAPNLPAQTNEADSDAYATLARDRRSIPLPRSVPEFGSNEIAYPTCRHPRNPRPERDSIVHRVSRLWALNNASVGLICPPFFASVGP